MRKAYKAETAAAKDLQKSLDTLKDDRNFRTRTFDKLSKLENKEYTFPSGGVIKMEEGDNFTYTFNNTLIKGAYDKELDTCKLYTVNMPKEKADEMLRSWRKENKETKENNKLFKAYARKELIKAVEGKNINELKNNAAGRKLSFTNADGKKKTFDPFEFDKETLSFTLPEATIEKNGKKITKKHIRIRASYDDKGLIMDKQLSAAKQELSAPAPKPAAGMKK